MDIALLLLVNCRFDIIINRTLCNYMTWLLCIYIKWHVATLYFTINSFINISSINELSYRRSKTSFECVNVKC